MEKGKREREGRRGGGEPLDARASPNTASRIGPTLCSKHERGRRVPLLVAALAYEAALGVPVATIYEGLYREVRELVMLRAKGLQVIVNSKQRSRKLAHLQRLVESSNAI